MKIKRMVAGVIIVLVLCLSGVTAWATTLEKDTITGAYEYPIVPGTNEWLSFTTHEQMVTACQIPEDILSKMTTEALVESVAAYPLLGDILLCGDIGFDVVKKEFNGLSALSEREDAIEAIEKHRNDVEAAYKSKEFVEGIDICLRIIEQRIGGEDTIRTYSNSEVTNNNVKTPNGTKVPHYENLTYADWDMFGSDIDLYEGYAVDPYPLAKKIGDRNPSYNCHSYAWHSTSSNNKYWIDNPEYYWKDGSYAAGTGF